VHGRGFGSLTFDGRGFESLSFWGQWWYSAWSRVRIFDFLGVNGGEWLWVQIFVFSGTIIGGVMHGLGFESLIHTAITLYPAIRTPSPVWVPDK
jgi:hypothetical protein